MTVLSFQRLLGDARPSSHIVALRGGEVLTLGRLRGDVVANAQSLSALGVRRALLICDDSYSFIVGLLALMRIGADLVLPPNGQPGTIAQLDDIFDLVVSDAPRPEIKRGFALTAGAPVASPLTSDSARSRIDFFTSGSTGAMKRVEKNAVSLEREAAALEQVWGERLAAARVLGTVSHQHIFGLAFRVVWPLLAGRPFSPTVHFAWETLLEEMADPAAIISSPAHLTRLAGLPAVPAARRPRLVFTAGAPLPDDAARDAETLFGAKPVEIFGSTETGAFAWRTDQESSPLWQALPGVEIASDPAGLLRVKSPFVPGDGWCDLADRVVLAAGGRFRFEGRADRIVKVEGKRVSLQQLEHDIVALRWVAAAAAAMTAADHPVLGAVVVLSQAGAAELARLGKFRFERLLRRELAHSQEAAALPRRWRFVDRLPMDGMGKRRGADVLALLEAQP